MWKALFAKTRCDAEIAQGKKRNLFQVGEGDDREDVDLGFVTEAGPTTQ